jgi:hypothetical protein
MSAYIKKLVDDLAQENATAPISNIRQRLEAWHSGLPHVARNRPFAMSELEQALGVAGRFLSRTLIEAGWTRKRRWEGTAQYYRYWVPPNL